MGPHLLVGTRKASIEKEHLERFRGTGSWAFVLPILGQALLQAPHMQNSFMPHATL